MSSVSEYEISLDSKPLEAKLLSGLHTGTGDEGPKVGSRNVANASLGIVDLVSCIEFRLCREF